MNGTEKEGVPEGCFELDPAALPLNPNDLYYPFVAKDVTDNIAAETDCVSSPQKSKAGPSANECTPVVVDDENSVARGSPRVLNTTDKENNQVKHSPLSYVMKAAKYLNSMEGRSSGGFSSSKGVLHQVDELNPQIKERSPRNSNIPSFTGHHIPGDLFHDFNADRSEDKFKEQQIWALYDPVEKFPKMYGKIKKIGSNPFLLHVAVLVGCSPSKKGIKLAFGTFKHETGRPRTFSRDFFSHMLKAENTTKKVEIYPREGQIWAMYKDWNVELSSSDVQNGQYEIVEVTSRSKGCIWVLFLVPVKGCRSVFEYPKRQRLSMRLPFEVKENELARFSHQIPAYQFTTEGGGSLAGSWELNPASVPSNLLSAK